MRIDPLELAAVFGRPAPTAEQIAVISAPLEPTLVIAGAGSGKTETIAARVAYLVANGLAEPGNIVGLTFTRKAATELAERVRSRLRMLAGAGVVDDAAALAGSEPVIGTYHSFAGRLIDEFGPLAGIEPTARVLTATASWQLARSVVGSWDADLDTDYGPDRVTQDLLAISGALGDHLVTTDMLDGELTRIIAALSDAPPSRGQRSQIHNGLVGPIAALTNRRALLPLVRAYDEAKREIHAVDFADQMRLAALLVETSAAVGQSLRARHPVVLLDEYQDTGHSQRVILRTLFGDPGPGLAPGGGPSRRGHCVTVVGDPVQSIYGWRGASASNLLRFATDFPRRDGSPAVTRPLLVSFRNDRRILDIANVASVDVRAGAVPVGELRPSDVAGRGKVSSALLTTIDDENEWLAGVLVDARERTSEDPSMAVLVRRRAAMPGVAAALRARGLVVEVVGVGGLVDEPEVADVIAMLRLAVDHRSGPAAVRILSGARWRLGIADLAALARRARELRVVSPGSPDGTAAGEGASGPLAKIRLALADAIGGEDVDQAGLADALADPGDADRYSAPGWRRINALRDELRWLRTRLTAPLGEIVTDIERVLGLEVEVLLGPDGRAHLDEFESIVADVAATGAGPVELLDYLATAGEREDGLPPGAAQSPPGRVQVLTVHSAKGLEWDVVAIPHLSDEVFPSGMSSSWLGDAGFLPPALRGDRADLPALDLPAGADQRELADAVQAHRAAWRALQLTEERRLFYVAVTRARHHLVLSAHHWGATRKTATGPGAFLRELADGSSDLLGDPDVWADPPVDGASNPLLDDPIVGEWPVDPLGDRRPSIEAAAELVRAAGRRTPEAVPTDVESEWDADIDLLLAERAAAASMPQEVDVPLPSAVSVSMLVELAADPRRLARSLHRPMPQPPAPQARRGTAFHAWLERHFGGDALLDLDELPGARDEGAAPDEQLSDLVAAFRASPWVDRVPIAVEVPFVTNVAGLTVRGRIDAVFADTDGGATVIDWKTGSVPTGAHAQAAAVQLTAYRLAWSRLRGLPLDNVRAAFYYVAAGRTITPEDFMDAADLEHLVAVSTSAR